MDQQAVFDKVATHLLTQGRRATEGYGTFITCCYKAPNGDMCAIGCLIPDNKYCPGLEGVAVAGIDFNTPTENDPVDPWSTTSKINGLKRALEYLDVKGGKDHDLLMQLQGIHDRYLPDQWQNALWNLAQSFQLSTTAIDKL